MAGQGETCVQLQPTLRNGHPATWHGEPSCRGFATAVARALPGFRRAVAEITKEESAGSFIIRHRSRGVCAPVRSWEI
jgi:hypothetical protein